MENGKYKGELDYFGKINGLGTMEFTNGNIYVGNWLDEQRFGHGIYIFLNTNFPFLNDFERIISFLKRYSYFFQVFNMLVKNRDFF